MTSADDRNQEALSPAAQVTITGRNVEVPEHFQERVNGKLAKIEKLDPTLTFFHVELQHEPNPRREAQANRIQITATARATSPALRRRKTASMPHWSPPLARWSAPCAR